MSPTKKKVTTKQAKKEPAGDSPIIAFTTPRDWADWLTSNHASSRGLWLKLAKKGAGVASVTYAEALEVALAWGWIDAQKDSYRRRPRPAPGASPNSSRCSRGMRSRTPEARSNEPPPWTPI